MSVFTNMLKHPNWVGALAAEGRVFYASDSAQDQAVTGQTSFAATTPTFLLRVSEGTTVIPLLMSLCQTGTVAGGAVQVVSEIDNAGRYNTGGTAETILCSRTSGALDGLPTCIFNSNPTATTGYGVRIFGITTGQDVSPAEGAVQEILWTPANGVPDFIVGPGAWATYTWAASTAPTWFWTFKWAEIPTSWLA